MGVQAADLSSFEGAASELAQSVRDSPEMTAELVGRAFRDLTESGLPVDEISRRARRIADELPTNRGVSRDVARMARESAPAIRAAVVASLPPELQRAAYADVELPPEGTESDGGDPSPTLSITAPREREAIDAEAPDDWRTVWLLGARDEVESNAQFLSARNFQAIRVSSRDQLPNLLKETCCGVAIHHGWWHQFENAEEMVSFVREQLDRSSIPFYRIDSNELGDEGAELLECALADYDTSTRSRIQIGDGCVLNPMDAQRLEGVAELLGSAGRASITMEGLADDEQRLLASAITLFDNELRGVTGTASDLVMLPLIQGRSGARVFRVRSPDRRAVYVAKLDAVSRLREERARAKAVAPDADGVQMAVHSLGGSAVLLQRLFTNLDEPLEGAPSLKERLEERSAWERGRQIDPEPNLSDLETGIDRLVVMLEQVRLRPSDGLGCNCWTGAEPLTALSTQGVRWRIASERGPFDPVDLLSWVETKVGELGDFCSVHGDVHLGNVLMLDDRAPRLIDFALGGKGHPCFDFVRLSSAVAFSCLRPVSDEERLREFFVRGHVEGAEADALLADFPDLLEGSRARLVATTVSRCRAAALGGLPENDQAEAHYLAMAYLISAQSLTMDEFQGIVVRAALAAVQPRLADLAA